MRGWLALPLLAAGLCLAQSTPPERSVGVRGVLEGVVAPPELRPRRTETGRPPIVVRVLRAAPHGSAVRYDLEFYGLEAGTFDLGDYLELSDGTRPTDLPELSVVILDPLLPFEAPAPEGVPPGALPVRGGYGNALVAAGVFWVLGLVGLCVGLLRRRRGERGVEQAAPPRDAVAELVDAASQRALSTEEQGQLERHLLTRWFLATGLSELPPEQALRQLRDDPTYGPRLEALEAWLHRPNPQAADLQALVAEVQP